MPFEQGKPKTGGRAKGVQNKSTLDLKSTIQGIVEKGFESIESDLQEMDAKDRVGFILKLAEFVIPKMRENKNDTNTIRLGLDCEAVYLDVQYV